MAKKITQYPASGGNPDVGSLIDISELSGGIYTSKKLTIQQLLDYLTANLDIGQSQVFKNNSGATINTGTPCELLSSASNIPTIRVINVSNFTGGLSKIYIPVTDVLNGADGTFIETGVITKDTTAWSVGSKLFFSFSLNALTTDATLEDQIFVGIVLTSGAQGKIFVAPTRPPQLIKGVSGQVPLFLDERKIGGNTHFTFVDVNGTEVGFRFSDNNNNLTQVGVTYLNVESEGLASNSVLRLANWATNSNKGIVSFRKSRGSKASPSKVLAQDNLGSIIYTGQADKSINGLPPIASGMTTAEIVVRALEDYIRNYDSLADETYANAHTQFEIYLQPQFSNVAGDSTPPNIRVFAVNGNGKVYFRNYNFPSASGLNGQTLVTDSFGNLTWQTLGGTVDGSGTATYLTFWVDSNTLGSTNWQFDDDSAKLYFYDSFNGNNAELSSIAGVACQQLRPVGQGAQSFQGFKYLLYTDSTENHPYLRLQKSYGTPNAQLYLPNSSRIGRIEFEGTSSVNDFTAGIEARTTQQHTATARGSEMWFYVTPNDSNNREVRLHIKQDGQVMLGTTYYPATAGTSGQILVNNGFNQLEWANQSGTGGRGFSPMSIAMCDTAPTAQTTQYYYQTTAECSMLISFAKIWGYSGSDQIRVGIYRGTLQDNNLVLIGEGVLNPAVIGENNVFMVAKVGQTLNVQAGEDLVIGFYAHGTSFRTIYRAGISDANFAISNTADITSFPATPTGTATSVRFACTLWQDF